MIKIPPLALVKQNTRSPVIENINSELQKQIEEFNLASEIKKNTTVAIVVGSRGIDNLQQIVAALVAEVRKNGANPLIVPGMGSHGGATAPGQKKVLAKLGITPESVNAPVHSSLETITLGHTPEGYPVFCDTIVASSDNVIFVNRVKPHTSFSGEIESGIMKMASIGIGNDVGCRNIHAIGLEKAVVASARLVLEKLPRVIGLALLENSNGKTCHMRLLRGKEIEMEEKRLLALAKSLSPKLPFSEIDLLIVEEMGKNISGTGMDTKVIGRVNRGGVTEDGPVIDKIVILDLTDEAGGNALGMGMADVTTRKLVDKIDYTATYENALSTRFLDRAKVPVTMENDSDAIIMGLRTLRNTDPKTFKVVRIKNTLDLELISVSEALLTQARNNPALKILSAPAEVQFDHSGKMLPQQVSD